MLEKLNISIGGRTLVYVSGDGNCIYNSLSVGICGNQSLSSDIPGRTRLDLIENRNANKN